jgi:hypothetical protein
MGERAPKYETREDADPSEYETFLRIEVMTPEEILKSKDLVDLVLKYGRPHESIFNMILGGRNRVALGLSSQEVEEVNTRVKGELAGKKSIDVQLRDSKLK